MRRLTASQRELCLAVVDAIAQAAGCVAQRGATRDDGGVDLVLCARGPRGTVREPCVEAQLAGWVDDADDEVFGHNLRTRPATVRRFPLAVKDHEELRSAGKGERAPRLLLVVVVPADAAGAATSSPEALMRDHRVYGLSLAGTAASNNSVNAAIALAPASLLTPATLTALMARAGPVR